MPPDDWQKPDISDDVSVLFGVALAGLLFLGWLYWMHS